MNSMNGYSQEIGSEQKAHEPLSKNQENMGSMWYQRKAWWQCGQLECGKRLSRRKARKATTFKKDPQLKKMGTNNKLVTISTDFTQVLEALRL